METNKQSLTGETSVGLQYLCGEIENVLLGP